MSPAWIVAGVVVLALALWAFIDAHSSKWRRP